MPTSRWRHGLRLLAVAHAAALIACDSQRTADYQGEALLGLQGSVDIVGDKGKGELVPALAFISGSDVFIIDADVHGKFPADFTLDVYTPPGKVATPKFQYPGDPMLSLGYIAAVPKEHPSKVRYAGGGTTGDSSCAGKGCVNKNTWCTTDDECYAETEMCPDAESPPEACTVTESSGDPGLKEDLLSHFAGLSENYLIAYLHGNAPKHSVTAYRLGAAKTGLSAGYHLIELKDQPPMEESEDAGPDCQDRAYELGVTRYNDKHGTHYEFGRSPTFGCFDDDPPSCDRAVGDEFQRLILKATAELDCAMEGTQKIPVPNPERHPIAVKIGPSLQIGGSD